MKMNLVECPFGSQGLRLRLGVGLVSTEEGRSSWWELEVYRNSELLLAHVDDVYEGIILGGSVGMSQL